MKRLAQPALPPALLIDFGPVPEAHCNDCLDGLFKALAVNPAGGQDDTIWRPHDNPWLAQHVEDVTAWMQRIMQGMQDMLAKLLTGQPIGALKKAEGWRTAVMEERQRTLDRLEAKGAAAFTLTDWLDVIDIILAELLPEGVIADMSEFMAVRSQMLGKVQGEMDRMARPNPGVRTVSSLLAATPISRRNLPPKLLTGVERSILDIAQARAAMYIGDIAAGTRKRMQGIILDHVQKMVLGEKEGTPDYLRSALFDEFGVLNRDFRRIAVTEAGEAFNNGYIGGQAPGTRVKRVEAYRGACDWCRKIHGRVFKVVAPAELQKDGETEVWVGKTNAKRSASPKMREAGILVDRSPDERWWVAAGVQHPHCRGRWVAADPIPEEDGGEDTDFRKWLRAELKRVEVPPPKAA